MFPSLELLSCSLQLFATFPLQTLHKNLAHKHPQGLLLTFLFRVFLGHACTAPPQRLLSGQLLLLGLHSATHPPATMSIQRFLPDRSQSVHQSTAEREPSSYSSYLCPPVSRPWHTLDIPPDTGCLIHQQCSINNHNLTLDQPQDLHLNSIPTARHLTCIKECKCQSILTALTDPQQEPAASP